MISLVRRLPQLQIQQFHIIRVRSKLSLSTDHNLLKSNDGGHGTLRASSDDEAEARLQNTLPSPLELQVPLSDQTYISILRTCIKTKSVVEAMQVYVHALVHKNQLSDFLNDYLVIIFSKCGAIEDAHKVAQSVSCLTVYSCTAIIAAYADASDGHGALEVYAYMQQARIQPNHYTFVSLFKACGIIRDLQCGMRLHSNICKKGLDMDIFIRNTLVSMYNKCNAILEAEDTFMKSIEHDTVSWNVMLSAYVDQRQGIKALLLYRQMQKEGVIPDKHTIVCVLQACGILAEGEEGSNVDREFLKIFCLDIGCALHAECNRTGFLLHSSIGNALITMYGKCGDCLQAENVFIRLFQQKLVSWTAMLSAYIDLGEGERGLKLYRQMLEDGIYSDRHTLVLALQLVGMLEKEDRTVSQKQLRLKIVESFHSDARQKGFVSHPYVITALLNAYGRSGMIKETEHLFDDLSNRDIVSWTTMLLAYLEQGNGQKVLQVYVHIQAQGVCPDQHVFVISVKACSLLAEYEGHVSSDHSMPNKAMIIGDALREDAYRLGYSSNVYVNNALLIMYTKCGNIGKAEFLFRKLSNRDIISWTAILSAYVDQGLGDKAVALYKKMKIKHLILDDYVLLRVLQTSSQTGSLESCQCVHFEVLCSGYDTDILIAANLIQAYGNCGSAGDAEAILHGLIELDIASWTACISSYAGEANLRSSIYLFEGMQQEGVIPNGLTFNSILAASSRAGLVVTGLTYFIIMVKNYGISADIKHYGSIVDMLGRSGHFNKLELVLKNMPYHADTNILFSLLGACRIHGNVELAKHAFIKSLNLEPKQTAAYDLMMNIYSDS